MAPINNRFKPNPTPNNTPDYTRGEKTVLRTEAHRTQNLARSAHADGTVSASEKRVVTASARDYHRDRFDLA